MRRGGQLPGNIDLHSKGIPKVPLLTFQNGLALFGYVSVRGKDTLTDEFR